MRAEFQAFRARLAAHSLLAGKVVDAVRLTDGGEPVRANYVVAKPAAPDRLGDDRYTAVQQAASRKRFTFDVRVVATAADGVLLLADAAIAQLVGHSLTVAGRSCDPIELVEGVEEGFEFDRTARLHWVDLSFRFVSRRA